MDEDLPKPRWVWGLTVQSCTTCLVINRITKFCAALKTNKITFGHLSLGWKALSCLGGFLCVFENMI